MFQICLEIVLRMTIITQKTVFYVGHIEHLPCHFCFESQDCFVFGNDALRQANKGTQKIEEHPLCSTRKICWQIADLCKPEIARPTVSLYLTRAIGPLSSNDVTGLVKICIYYLLTGCKGRTRKYKSKVFHTARACEGCLENQRLVFPGTARAPS